MSENIGKLTTPSGEGASIEVLENSININSNNNNYININKDIINIKGKAQFTSITPNSINEYVSICGDNDSKELRISGSTIWQDGGYLLLYPKNINNANIGGIFNSSFKLGAMSKDGKPLEITIDTDNNNVIYSNSVDQTNATLLGSINENIASTIGNKYIKLNNGLILQYGGGSSSGTGIITYTVPYTVYVRVIAQVTGIEANGIFTIRTTNDSQTGFSYKTTDNSGITTGGIGFCWFAIGY